MIMRKSCETCKHDDRDYPSYPYKAPCNECVYGADNVPVKWEAAEFYEPDTNADRIRAMSDEELAEDFCKTVLGVMNQLGVVNTGSVEDAVRKRLEWLKQPAEDR
jgi:hypothetical protein